MIFLFFFFLVCCSREYLRNVYGNIWDGFGDYMELFHTTLSFGSVTERFFVYSGELMVLLFTCVYI